MLELLANLLLPAIMAWFATKLTIQYAPFLGLVHEPNQRSSHVKITPHGGGIGIVVSTILFTLWLLWQEDVNDVTYWVAIGLALIVAIKGLVDDIHNLPASLRLVIQIAACAGLLAALYVLPVNGLEAIEGIPLWLSFGLVLFAGVWWLNLFNFMDGIDGIAATEAIFMLAGAAGLIAFVHPEVMQTTVWVWMLCLASAAAGFLWHNWSPAKIFMGDTGSLFLAFMILFLALLTISLKWMNYASWAILAAVFISDASVTLFKRLLAGQRLSEAHRSHAYQRLARHWQSHAKVTLLAIGINVFWLLPLAWLSLRYSEQSHFWLVLAYLPISIGVWAIGAGETENSGSFADYMTGLQRPTKQWLMAVADVLALMAAAWGAYYLRLGDDFTPNRVQLFITVIAPAIAIPVFIRLGLYRSVIRYLGEQAFWSILKAVSITTVLWATLAFLLSLGGKEAGLPRSVPLLFWLLAVALVLGTRFAARWLLWIPVRKQFASGKQVLIYGAGEAGRQLAVSLRQAQQLFPAGFLDDNTQLQGRDVDGLRVYTPNFLAELIERLGVEDVIVTLPSSSQSRRREIVHFLEQFPVKVRILPSLSDIASGKHLVNMLREVDIGDLLGRDPVVSDPQLLGQCITGKNVMVTGAGGSIGSELCQQIVALHPERLILLEQNEHALYQIERSLIPQANCLLIPALGSVKDKALLNRLFREHHIHTVYHAAAHKHVPLVEANITEGAANNVFGTWNVAEAAFTNGAETFVLISTDKAVRPTNVMGATKRWAELIMQHFAEQARLQASGQRFCAVRFGNVLGSSGSVIPLFKEQIAHGGPITVTHPDIIRYFMSIHEAVELVIQTGSMAQGGDIFLLDMGEPVKITELARDMIRLAGRTLRNESNPTGDIEITFTGLRPGEKLYEELLISSSNAQPTRHPKIMRGDEPFIGSPALEKILTELQQMLVNHQADAAKQLLLQVALDTPTPTPPNIA
ncbi:MAG: polysaccharide biosynthesis protein [Thiothrix sp.]|uniref:polysaccharide biosynthesis protein n=1 Tax=Thiothrix sp. TaxID=1032 RepID=UPI00263223E2|nr:polysaccharide biosynthesis protein [Thiothrix sp.]MDD5394696.1 polysaccharide biosynthesis protein [Thiothrix sp.]